MTPLDDTITNVLEHWENIATNAVGKLIAANHCILACKTLAVTLDELGYTATVHTVQTVVTNQTARQLIANKVPTNQWPEFAWSVGTDRRPGMTGYPGHLILTIDNHLIDPTTSQFHRPGRLHLPNIVVCDATDFHTTSHTSATGPDGTTIDWWNDPTLGNLHRTSPDWTRNWRTWHHTLATRL